MVEKMRTETSCVGGFSGMVKFFFSFEQNNGVEMESESDWAA